MLRLLPVLLLLLCAPCAGAATVSYDPTVVRYEAAPGEANAPAIAFPYDADEKVHVIEVTDPSAPLTAGAGCKQGGEHAVRCTTVRAGVTAVVGLGDGDDTATAERFVNLVADGGPGDDTLTGAMMSDRLDGGPGRDTLDGRLTIDQLIDKDTDPDVLRGGQAGSGNMDLLSYEGRATPIEVDLESETTSDGDTVIGVEAVLGD